MTLNELIRLKLRHYSLADVVESLIELKSCYVVYATYEKLKKMCQPSDFDKEDPYIKVAVFLREKDKMTSTKLYMLFANHGQVYYSDGEVLEYYMLSEIDLFYNFQVNNSQVELLPKYARHYIFSEDEQAIQDWTASFHYENIFSRFWLDGAEDLAGFAGFYFLEDE